MINIFLGFIFIILGIFWFTTLAKATGVLFTLLLIWAIIHIIAGVQCFVKFGNYIKYGGGIPCTHLSGLPVGEVSCVAIAPAEKMVILVGKSRYELPYWKITAAEMREKNSLMAASTGDAVAGALLFGALGAIVASRPKNKKEYIMIISYNSDNGSNTVALAVPANQRAAAEKLLKQVKGKLTFTQNVTL